MYNSISPMALVAADFVPLKKNEYLNIFIVTEYCNS